MHARACMCVFFKTLKKCISYLLLFQSLYLYKGSGQLLVGSRGEVSFLSRPEESSHQLPTAVQSSLLIPCHLNLTKDNLVI